MSAPMPEGLRDGQVARVVLEGPVLTYSSMDGPYFYLGSAGHLVEVRATNPHVKSIEVIPDPPKVGDRVRHNADPMCAGIVVAVSSDGLMLRYWSERYEMLSTDWRYAADFTVVARASYTTVDGAS